MDKMTLPGGWLVKTNQYPREQEKHVINSALEIHIFQHLRPPTDAYVKNIPRSSTLHQEYLSFKGIN